MEERLIELETKVAYQERTLEQLNEVLTEQEARLERLEKQLRTLGDRVQDALSC